MKTPLSIRILYWLTNIVFVLMILLTSIVFITNLIFLTDLFTEDIQLRIQMPVPFEVVENGKMNLINSTETVRIEEAYGKLYLVDTPFFITKIVARILFVMLLLGLFMMWRFKQLMTNLKNGLFFVKENVLGIKQIAYGLLTLWISTRVYMEIINHLFVKHLEFESIIVGSHRFDVDFIIQLALGLWVMAHVFGKGIELRDYKDLTI
jgi:DUF2975 family protein